MAHFRKLWLKSCILMVNIFRDVQAKTSPNHTLPQDSPIIEMDHSPEWLVGLTSKFVSWLGLKNVPTGKFFYPAKGLGLLEKLQCLKLQNRLELDFTELIDFSLSIGSSAEIVLKSGPQVWGAQNLAFRFSPLIMALYHKSRTWTWT